MAMVVAQTDENLEDNDSSSSWVRLNVGGKFFCTTIDTMTVREPDSMLAAMFSGRYPLKQEKGYVLIDRDGDYFGYILNWLKDGDFSYFGGSQILTASKRGTILSTTWADRQNKHEEY
ncbi:hypothetical protein M0R45_013707 [Rubus argutus]|uniref:Potassium channel tetramerisation-type BTB domain-containing protein n=1 Tax=Rubus argutus TaxID=59490 RepID=A0AAW1XM08_RUBAR